jgi:integrator complex subunit 3
VIVVYIEPAILLMIHSIPKYVDITASLLEFLLSERDQFETIRRGEVQKGIHNSLKTILEKGVVT